MRRQQMLSVEDENVAQFIEISRFDMCFRPSWNTRNSSGRTNAFKIEGELPQRPGPSTSPNPIQESENERLSRACEYDGAKSG